MEIFLALISSILWAIFDLIRKKTVLFIDKKKVIFLIVVSQFIFFLFFLYFSDFYIEIQNYYLYGLVLIFLNLVSIYFFLKVLQTGDISIYIPMLSFTPLFSALYAQLILNEFLSIKQYFGIILIILGAFLLHSNNFKFKSILASPIVFFKSSNSYLILLVSLIWSLTIVLDKECMKYTDLYFHGFIQSFGMLVIVFIINRKNIFKNSIINFYKTYRYKKLILINCLMIISFMCTFFQLIALKYNLVAELESLKRAIGVTLSLFFGYYFFNEKIKLNRISSVLIILLGVSNVINVT